MTASSSKGPTQRESAASGLRVLLEEEGIAGAGQGDPQASSRDPLPSSRPQPDGEASQVEEVDGTWSLTGDTRQDEQVSAPPPRRPPRGLLPSCPSEDFSFIEVSGESRWTGCWRDQGMWVMVSKPHSQSFPEQ